MFKDTHSQFTGNVAELFAGVGGFRLGLEKAGWKTAFSNQWEPGTKRQHASEVYIKNFGPEGHSNLDVSLVSEIPTDFELLVGGFPCQDYSVAKSLSTSTGLQGKKGVLWWDILRLVSLHKPKQIFLENVDRLLKSPSQQRGRDFAVMLSTLGREGYSVEWRVVNSADYGFPQRRKRVFIVAKLGGETPSSNSLLESGVLPRALPVEDVYSIESGFVDKNPVYVSESFGLGLKNSPFKEAGYFLDGEFITSSIKVEMPKNPKTLKDILLPSSDISEELIIDEESIPKWRYLKGAKKEERITKEGYRWTYSEGSMSFPDSLEKPSRTLLTGEWGQTPSRFKHVISQDGVLRRLDVREMERLNGFPDDWTKFGINGEIPAGRRAFFMGNALVIGLVELVGEELRAQLR